MFKAITVKNINLSDVETFGEVGALDRHNVKVV